MSRYLEQIRALTPEQRVALRDAIVDCRHPVGPRLVAYVQPRAGCSVDGNALAAFVRRELPEYMVPAAFVPMDAFPLTPAGKIDRRALPEPFGARPEAARGGPPQGATEESLARVWSEVLGVPAVERDDDFFADLGGHSLLVTRLLAAVESTLGIELPVSALFEAPTVARLAGVIDTKRSGVQQSDTPAIERIPRDGRRVSVEEIES